MKDEHTRTCEWCGKSGLTRQGLYAHKKTCPNKPKEEVKEPPETITETEPETVDAKVDVKPLPKPRPSPLEEEETDQEEEEDTNIDFIMLPLIAIIVIVAGIYMFRDKVLEFFRRYGKPPAPYGIPEYEYDR